MKKTALCTKLLLVSCTILLAAKCAGDAKPEHKAAPTQQGPESAVWPDRDWLLDCVVKSVPDTLKSYDPQTGEFGTKPWICNDQQVMFPLAVAWAAPGRNNPYYHNTEILKIIAKAGEKLVDEQDESGRWTFRKKDNSTWGQSHITWTYTRWIRTFNLVKDALPPESRAKWEKGLRLGYKYIAEFCSGTNTHNIAIYHAAGLYVAGIVFGNEEWKTIAANLMHRLIARQSPDGYWSEHLGPVVVYNYVYLEALGIYYHYSKDPVVLEALTRGARFHNILRWPNGTIASVVDERSGYSSSRRMGNVGFTFTPEGRRYLEQQLGPFYRKKALINMDAAATFLQEGDSGELAPIPGKTSKYLSGDGKFLVARSAPYQWVLSAYSCKAMKSRWFMDRQTHVELCHDKLGVIGTGGNTKMQPYFSTFTFGDPDSFQPDHSTAAPHFFPKNNLRYIPDAAKITGNTVKLTYGKNQCQVSVLPGLDILTLEYKLNNTPDAPAMAHFPVILNGSVTGAAGQKIEDGKVYTGKDLGGELTFSNGLTITIPGLAQVRTNVTGFNPYHKYGKGNGSRLVISVPLSEKDPVRQLIFSGKKATGTTAVHAEKKISQKNI